MPTPHKIKIKHLGGDITVTVKGVVASCVFKGEYRYKGMTYGVEFDMEHYIIPVLGFDNSPVGEQCRECGKIIN